VEKSFLEKIGSSPLVRSSTGNERFACSKVDEIIGTDQLVSFRSYFVAHYFDRIFWISIKGNKGSFTVNDLNCFYNLVSWQLLSMYKGE